MWGKTGFLKHLENELPGWVAEGWVSAEHGAEILHRYDARKDQTSFIAAAFGVLGVMLVLSGVITFFAANWSEMAKITKLILLFGGLIGAYVLAIKPFNRDDYPKLWAAMLLLAAGMFGANIMLIAQIYHIDSHYPNGVLLWASGALLLAWMVPAQAVMVMALALAALWTGMETFGFDHPNFLFPVFFAVAALRIVRQGWRFAAHVAALALILWSLFAYFDAFDYSRRGAELLVTELMFIGWLSLFVVGLLMSHWSRVRAWASHVQRYSVFAALGFFYILTSPRLHSGLGPYWSGRPQRAAFDNEAIVAVVLALLLLVALAAWHHLLTRNTSRAPFLDWARWLLAGCVVLLLGSAFVGGESGGYIAIAFNLFYFAGLVWLVAAGVHFSDRALVNLAFIFFAITLITRYFDTFWSLMNRSFFFMAGGVLLLVIGYVLERQRRNFTGRIEQQRIVTGEGAA
ncbi:MAG: DUF2157 domain-containing protein [Proteobacteria bacterium]|nr:DUF2157 domain-containing protein [Pseudomonadota bacterium]